MGRGRKKHNTEETHDDDFVVDRSTWPEETHADRITLGNITDSVVRLDEIMFSQEIDLVKLRETDWIDERSEPEVEFDTEVEQLHGLMI